MSLNRLGDQIYFFDYVVISGNGILIRKKIDEEFIRKIAPHIRYIYVKDFVLGDDGRIDYVAASSGIVPYENIFSILDKHISKDQSVIISVETHAKNEKDRYNNSLESVAFLRSLLRKISRS